VTASVLPDRVTNNEETCNDMRRLPAEWEPQSGVQLTWPHRHGDWAPWLEQVEPVFVEIALHICAREKLLLVCYDAEHQQHVLALLRARGVDLTTVQSHVLASNDTWARDHGPISILEDGKPKLLDFTFNGWGQKFDAQLDNQLTAGLDKLAAFHHTTVETIDMVLEGGGIETDGEGTLLTTASCQLSPMRNPTLSREMIEQRLTEAFGVGRFLWLQHGHLEGDDTDSHIDTLVRFADPATLVYVACDDPNDSHYADLKAMEAELQAFRQADGEAYSLVPLPWPAPIHNQDGKRLPASYANYLIINGAVLVPTYRDAADEQALEILRRCYPGHQIIGIDCLPLIYQYGSLHCVTMNYIDGIL
jgi:agmatine deiminase